MLTASDSKAALTLVTSAAVNTVTALLGRASGSAEQKRALLLDGVPEVIAYYSAGSSALAADFYDDERERAAPPKLYIAEAVIVDRAEKIRRAVAWASDPLFAGDPATTAGRLADVVQLESARPFRDTVLTNRRRDPSAVGWRRVTNGGCKLCVMLASRGAVYSDQTARFATHTNCKCTAQPVFSSNDYGEEANALQYVASRKRRTPEQQANLREYLNTNFSDFPG
jgi:hypothetical protein